MRWALCLVVISALAFGSACEDDTLYKIGKAPVNNGSGKTDGQAKDGSAAEAGSDDATGG